MRISVARRASSAIGWWMVVSGGQTVRASVVLSKPATEPRRNLQPTLVGNRQHAGGHVVVGSEDCTGGTGWSSSIRPPRTWIEIELAIADEARLEGDCPVERAAIAEQAVVRAGVVGGPDEADAAVALLMRWVVMSSAARRRP